jgi:hypothetical protein
VSFRSKSRCTVIRNTPIYTFLLRLQHSTADWAHKRKSIQRGQTGDFWLSDIVTVETAELHTWCPRVRPAARRRNNHCLFAFLWYCFPFLLCLLFVLSETFLSRYPTFSPSSLLSLNDVFCVWLSVLLLTLLAFVLCLRLWLLRPTVSPIAVTLLRRVLDWVQLSGLDLLWVLLEAWIRAHKMWRFQKARVLQNTALFFCIFSSWPRRHDPVTSTSFVLFVCVYS